MNKLSKLFKTQPTSTQAHKTEKANSATIFSRGNGSGNKLLLSLKNLFFRTDKSSAKAVVTKAVSEEMTEPIKSGAKIFAKPGPDKSSAKAVVTQAVSEEMTEPIKSEAIIFPKPGPDLRSRVRQVYRQLPNQTEVTVSKFDSAIHKLFDGAKLLDDELETLKALAHIKTFVEQNEEMDTSIKDQLETSVGQNEEKHISIRDQLLNYIELLKGLADNYQIKITTGYSPQSQMVEFFKKDFDSKLNSMIGEIPGMNAQSPDVKIIRAAIIRTAKSELSLQINGDLNNLKKENFEKEFEKTLKLQFKNTISLDLLSQIKKAVSVSFDFAVDEELRKM